MLKLIIYLVVLISVSAEAAKILAVFPVPSISHQVVFRPLTQELAKRGHEVVVVTPDPAFPKGGAPGNLTEIDVHDLSYKVWRDMDMKLDSGKKLNLISQLSASFEVIITIFVEQMKSVEMQSILKDNDKQFDLLLMEGCVRSVLVLSHIYQVPVIQVSSLGGFHDNFVALGAPSHPILYASALPDSIQNISVWKKVSEINNCYSIQGMCSYFLEEERNKRLRNLFGPDTPDLSFLDNNVQMLFQNINPIWAVNRPVPPGVLYTGGLDQKPVEALTQDLQAHLDVSTNGVIYMSFGTNVYTSTLPQDKIQMFINVFSRLPFNVLWKWDAEELPGISKNVKISKWFPQSGLLRHPNIKLFITQGGLQSTDEAIIAGVPLIGIPMKGDQWFNTEQYVRQKIGFKLDFKNLREAELLNAITTVIGDESYRRNVVKLGALMRDQPQSPLQRAVWWTEYVLKNGGAKDLRASAANISWSEYLEVELFVILILISLITIIFIYFFMHALLKHSFSQLCLILIKIKLN